MFYIKFQLDLHLNQLLWTFYSRRKPGFAIIHEKSEVVKRALEVFSFIKIIILKWIQFLLEKLFININFLKFIKYIFLTLTAF